MNRFTWKPGDLQEVSEKLAKAQKLKPLFVDQKTLLAIKPYARVLHAAFVACQRSVAQQVREKLAKAWTPTTPEEIQAQQIADSLDLSTLIAIVDGTSDLGTTVSRRVARMALAQLGFNDTSELVNQTDWASAEWAKQRAAELVGRMYDQNGNLVPSNNPQMRIDTPTRNMVRNVIADGLKGGKTSGQIADILEGSGQYPFSEERAALIANTEIRRAHSQGALVGYKAARAAGVNVKKEWLVADSPCPEICEPNGEQGPIDLDEDFDSGDDAPPGHPNCECAIVPVVETEGGVQEDEE